VSGDGDVRSVKTGLILSSRADRDGYRLVDLYVGRRTTRKVHHLVLLAFIGPAPEGKPHCDHINRDRADNRLANLRWTSVSANLMNTEARSLLGVKGVRHRPDRPNPWQAYTTTGGFRSLGHFATLQQAADARAAHERGLNS